MTTSEDPDRTAEFASVRAELPAYPTPGIGALLRVGCLALGMRNSGHTDEVVEQWRENAKAAIRTPSIFPPEEQ